MISCKLQGGLGNYMFQIGAICSLASTTGYTFNIENAAQEVEEWAEEKENEILAMKESENYRREFIGNVSHELKTPIFNIQGYVHTLLDGGLHDNEINEKYLIRTNKSVDRMINIVEDLETITRLETEKSELDIRKVNIIDLVNDIFEQLEMKAEAADIKLSLKNESSTQFVLCDLDKIQQVFVNLISNSIKY